MATARRNGRGGQGGKPSRWTRGVATAVGAALAGAPVWAQTGVPVSDLVGASVASGQGELRKRGFSLVHSDTTGQTSWQYWWNGARNQCVLATANDGKFVRLGKADEHDCNQQSAAPATQTTPTTAEASPEISDGAKVAIGAAALLGVFALLHKSHERKKERANSSAQDTAEFERGYRDGMYHQSYHNYNNNREYSDGYSAGSEKRSQETSYRSNRGYHSGYTPYVNVNDLVGARASGAEGDLRSRGFRSTSGYKANERSYTYWWNGSTRQCVNAAVYDGRIEAMTSAGETYCQR